MGEDSKKEIISLSIRSLITIALILIGKLYLTEEFSWYANLIVMLAAYFVIGYDILFKAFKSVFIEHEIFNECMLMLLASAGAFALRAYGPEHNEYMEGVLVILLYQIGEMFEDLAEEKSKKAITKAIDLREEKASVEVDGKIIQKPSEKLEIGDIVMIGSGMKVLCDGVVLSGNGETDESSLTGEFNLISKKEGDEVVSGSILKSGSLKVKVSKPYSESTIAKLLDLVETSAEKKSKATRFITK
ncbi:MAG TPA: heavy metal translocating P-type ATPase, partial [Firmicutes bacterium]|nr:heavy metal translocating P-type ATPase [Bacillota bacterium]